MTENQDSPEGRGLGEADPEKKLDQVLEQSEEKGEEIAKIGRELTEAGRSMADMAKATRDVVHVVKTPPNVQFLISDWELTNQQADLVLAQLGSVDVPAFDSTTGTSSSTSVAIATPELFSIVPADDHPRLTTVLENLQQVSERAADANEVARLMKTLRLDQSSPGRKSAMELFQTAHAAFKAPVSDDNPVVTSLIPMRESIRTTIDFLLKKRPRQEKTKGEWGKVVSIGAQLKRNGLPPAIVNSWAFQWTNTLQNDLSPAKDEEITRDEWRQRLVRSTLFLKGFLAGIDPSKIRK